MKKSVVEVEKFIESQVILGRSDNTISTYRFILNRFADWLEENCGNIAEITRYDVQAYVKALENEGQVASTIDKVFACLSVYARFLELPDAVKNIKRVMPTKKRNVAPKSLSDAERRKLLRDVEKNGSLRDIAIVYTLLLTGVRVSELCELDRSDITIKARSGSVLINGKGDKQRTVPLSPEARHHLTRYLETRTDGDPALFISNQHNRISPRTVQHMLAKYGTFPHALRHTFSRRLLADGWDISTVAELAGHADINVTRRYTKPTEEELANAIDRAFS